MAPFIQTKGLTYAYPLESSGQIVALQGVDVTIERGEYVALIGANGSGKSTLVRHFNALLLPTAGQVWVDGLSTSQPELRWKVRQRVGMVFQNPDNQLVANTVEEDIAFGPENRGLPPAQIRARVDEALQLVGLVDYRTHPPQMLSGGQKQHVAIAGVLATRPSCIIFDEPTSMLDPPSRQAMLDTIRRLNVEEGITVILITQSMDEAALAHRVLVMHHGRIVMDGSPSAIFAHHERLQALGLELPFPIQMARHLKRGGMSLPSTCLTLEALVNALC